MPPPLALSLGLLFIVYLLRRDAKECPKLSAAVWIPTVWLMIIGSRPVSIWFDLSTPAPIEEGSAFDRLVYTVLIILGGVVVAKRRVKIGQLIRDNPWFSLLLLYEGLSIVWSDYPFVAFKRWTKAIGDPVMITILWTEVDSARAITATIRRSAYVLITLSVIFCKYYENIGRAFDGWGHAFYTGVTTNKNMLGYLLFAFGLFFAASLISRFSQVDGDTNSKRRIDRSVDVLFLIMIGWLHLITDSKTALLTTFVGVVVMLASQLGFMRRRFGLWAFAAILLLSILETSSSVSSYVLSGAGRDATFTGRTGLWETLLREPVNPIIGVGYASFWLGERLQRYWEMYPASPPTEAHNGYLEMYLNLGVLGLCVLAGVLWNGLRRTRLRLVSWDSVAQNFHWSTIRTFGFAYGVAYLLYNVTEATFQGMNFLFVIFVMVIFDYRPQSSTRDYARKVAHERSRPQRSTLQIPARSWPRRAQPARQVMREGNGPKKGITVKSRANRFQNPAMSSRESPEGKRIRLK